MALIFILLASGISSFPFIGKAYYPKLRDVRAHPPLSPPTPSLLDIDKNRNRIGDFLEEEMQQKIAEENGTQLVKVVVILNAIPSETHTSAFDKFDGTMTRGPWRHALFGFGGMIPYLSIARFAEQCPDLLLVQRDYEYHAVMAYAARQGRARTYVWDTLGFKGDPNSSIAISDTGIDDSHPNHQDYGDANFSKKIVGWHDDVGAETTPYDDNGHGSHCAGISSGDGFFATDAGGRAQATWSGYVGSLDTQFIYIISGFNVTKSGGTWNITLEAIQSGTTPFRKIDTVYLYYAGYSADTAEWEQVAFLDTSVSETEHVLDYQVPEDKIGYYHIGIHGAGRCYLRVRMHWPYDQPTDTYPAWTGVAHDTRLVGVKGLDATGSGTTTDLVNGIDWVIENRIRYHILVLSMSWAGSTYDKAIDYAVTNATKNGIICVAAAGNAGSGGNYVHTPGSNNYTISVGAVSLTDNVTSYSSQGGTSEADSNVIKPDIVAPGGSFLLLPMFSTDANDNDAEGHWADSAPDDACPMQGTSMSTPFIAGCAAVVAQALGGYAGWDFGSNAMALKVKMLLLMTATETHPLMREEEGALTSPTLDRGGKDAHEGYGRVNLDAAVEAATLAWDVTDGGNLSETLYAADYLAKYRDAAILRHAWARNVDLLADYNYTFTLNVPSTGDFDLYVYKGSPDDYGEPVIKWNSTQAGSGVNEHISTGFLTAADAGTYYVVTKAVSGYGAFNLTSTATIRDVAVTNLTVSPLRALRGQPICINVTVENRGDYPETVNVTVYADGDGGVHVDIGNETVSLNVGNSTILDFTWDTAAVSAGKYWITAEAVIPEDGNPEDNIARTEVECIIFVLRGSGVFPLFAP